MNKNIRLRINEISMILRNENPNIEQTKKIFFEIEELISDEISERESEVVNFVVCGLSNLEIAERLMIEEKTVKFHLSKVYKKMGIKNRSELIVEHYKNELRKVNNDKDNLQKQLKELSIGAN